MLEMEDSEVYYKWANPQFSPELDWGITFSKYDFPWREIRFSKFTAKECYVKYTSTIRDAATFFKKILGSKDKLVKMVANQLEEPPRAFYGTQPEEEQKVAGNEQNANLADAAQESDSEQFCRCVRLGRPFKSLTGYFVACEADAECPNGGWLHPECTDDLCNMTRAQIDNMIVWYCQDCRDKVPEIEAIKNEEEPLEDDESEGNEHG